MRNFNRQMDSFVGMDPAQKNQMIPARLLKRIQGEIDSVVYRRQIIQSGRTIGIADGNEISVPILFDRPA